MSRTSKVIGEYELRLTFKDDTVGDVSFTGREWNGVFEPLRDPKRFAKVRSDCPIVWSNGLDPDSDETSSLALRLEPSGPIRFGFSTIT